ncbi:hypothetical protein TL16_g01606 [Triparma laevis f. inornata]|uniref:Uncharacterized protein n=2 Tax=Triparma laevis TaxID=1534972 RepID=A0A9W7E3I4_9STRA|nr:hypothetical protein TL16_g01606 [Triparma laevis f. inornata]GMH64443.1 hypothetical protein TrLO_g8299 [Triparma laevis f. longispina]
MGVAKLKRKEWAKVDEVDIAEVGEQFNIVVIKSSIDIAEDISSWYETNLPTSNLTTVEKKNQKKFLIEIAKRYRALAKMSRIGVAVKMILTLSLDQRTPESNYGDIKTVQVIGVISSIVSGAFIITDGNFGFILSMYLKSPFDPYFGWISKIGGWEKKRQMFGMFLFNACYFSQFVFAMSLFGQAFGSRAPVFALLGIEFCAVCAYMGLWKWELYGWALLAKPSTFAYYIAPFIVWAFYYMLGGAYLSLTTAMAGYGTSLGLAAVGLTTFLMNYDSNFNQKLFWKAKLGKQHARECYNDEKIREKGIATKDDEIWLWVGGNHPTKKSGKFKVKPEP